MTKDRYASIWDAIEDTPEQAENMKLRAELMTALRARIESEGWTQAETAERLGVTQPRVSDLVRGKINLFALDALVNLLAKAGLRAEVKVLVTA